MAWFKAKYAKANYSVVHILKSLTYFEEPEKDPMPDMLVNLNHHDYRENRQYTMTFD